MQAELLTLCTRNRLNNMVASFSKQRVEPTAIFSVLSIFLEYLSSHHAYSALFCAVDLSLFCSSSYYIYADF